MLPFVAYGDLVITFRGDVRSGDVVVMGLPGYGRVVKRARQITEHTLSLASDNRETLSACCGVPQSKKNLIGKVLCKINFKRQSRFLTMTE